MKFPTAVVMAALPSFPVVSRVCIFVAAAAAAALVALNISFFPSSSSASGGNALSALQIVSLTLPPSSLLPLSPYLWSGRSPFLAVENLGWRFEFRFLVCVRRLRRRRRRRRRRRF